MMNSLMAKGIVLGMASMGVIIDKLENDDNGIILYFSVPKTSTHINAKGEQMAGKVLARRIKETLSELGFKFSICKFKIRDEDWNKSKEQEVRRKWGNINE